ncbi:MAG: HEAT repeat domain-containing protein [Promethearchaeota archaeon]
MSSEHINELIKKLGGNTKTRLDAANELAAMGNDALGDVTNLLHHEDYTYRRIAAYILGKIGNPDSVEALVEALGDDESDVRKSAAQALNRIGKPAIPLLIRALGNISKDVRASSVWSISKMGAIAVEPLIEALYSEVKDVRSSSVWALSKIGVPAIEPLIKLIDNEEKNVRESAIWGLSKIGRPAIERLAEIWNVRIGSEAKEGESETDSVDLNDLLDNGEAAIKQWIKFMLKTREEQSAAATPEIEDSIPSEEKPANEE